MGLERGCYTGAQPSRPSFSSHAEDLGLLDGISKGECVYVQTENKGVDVKVEESEDV